MELRKQWRVESTVPMRTERQPKLEELKTRATVFYMGKAVWDHRLLFV